MAQETNGEGGRRPITRGTRRVMKIMLFFSFLFHLVILIGLQKAFPVDWVKKPLKTYHVELLRPSVDPLEDEKGDKAEFTKVAPGEKISSRKTEDTISLDTQDKRYLSYAKTIKAKLMEHWEYPHKAWENLIEGDVRLVFSLDRQGHLRGIRILQATQHKILVHETTRTIRSAAPFPPFPGSVTVTKLHIKADFAYKLTDGK